MATASSPIAEIDAGRVDACAELRPSLDLQVDGATAA